MDPIEKFKAWLSEAEKTEPNDPNAMTLATVSAQGFPSARIVLCRGANADGFRFYTNYESRKGQELAENPHVALIFYWKTLHKQVRIEGVATQTSADDSDEYFNSRHPRSRRGAIASKQSHVIENYEELMARMHKAEADFPDDNAIPRPEWWGGFLVAPKRIEFWEDRDNRLHERHVFERDDAGEWRTPYMLSP